MWGQSAGLSPRVRGNQRGPDEVLRTSMATGLSPRVRGNPSSRPRSFLSIPSRSIPACTGEPRAIPSSSLTSANRVYPRVYGGTPPKAQVPQACSRLQVYPRVYGGTLRIKPECLPVTRGSIPACTGEPEVIGIGSWASSFGLSPRVRGNQTALLLDWSLYSEPRSIPACTGEPGLEF